MQKYLFLIFTLLVFACKKNEVDTPLAKVNQFPKLITISDTDGVVPIYQIKYYYNDSNRIDSIRIANLVYEFDYTTFNNNSKIIITQNDNPYALGGILAYDNEFFNLTSFTQFNSITDSAIRKFEYDSINRLKIFDCKQYSELFDFTLLQTYKKDTVFVHIDCQPFLFSLNDTMINTRNDMSKGLPYLLLTKIRNTKSVVAEDLLSALPLSSFTNKLPSKIIRNNIQIDYTYEYDEKERVNKVILNKKNRATSVIETTTTIKIFY